jgi:hypothetical protein
MPFTAPSHQRPAELRRDPSDVGVHRLDQSSHGRGGIDGEAAHAPQIRDVVARSLVTIPREHAGRVHRDSSPDRGRRSFRRSV